ncbi:MAG: hypothetical protein ABI861_01890 [Panacibacter sp.]
MQRFIYTIVFLSVFATAFAQDDDIPTYRSKRDNFLKMTEKDLRADLATFTLGGLDEATGKEPLPYVPVVAYGTDSVLFQKDNIKVIIKAGTFNPAKHKILLYDEKYVTKINNKPYYGVIGKMPKTTIDYILITIGRDTITIPPAAYADLYNPVFCKPGSNAKTKCGTGVYFSNDNHRMYIYMLNGDGREGYEVTWVIQDKQYLRRVVDWDF